jgi:hypothetical protein
VARVNHRDAGDRRGEGELAGSAPGSSRTPWPVGGPIYETYLVGPRDTDIESRWRTEIGWPVFRLSA